jgi:membrane-bound ClpP family serine protease
MTVPIVVLLVVGAALLVAEAHIVSYGVLGSAGVAALAVGVVLAVSAAGASVALSLALALPLAAALAAFMVVAGGKVLAVRRRRPLGGAEGLIGRVGVVRHGDVLVRGERWRAVRSPLDEDEPMPAEGEHVVVERVHGLAVCVRRAEEWELLP